MLITFLGMDPYLAVGIALSSDVLASAVSPKKRAIQSVVYGVLIGFICGFVGAGGGMMMLLILTSVLGILIIISIPFSLKFLNLI